jgi:hypothetical protein
MQSVELLTLKKRRSPVEMLIARTANEELWSASSDERPHPIALTILRTPAHHQRELKWRIVPSLRR